MRETRPSLSRRCLTINRKQPTQAAFDPSLTPHKLSVDHAAKMYYTYYAYHPQQTGSTLPELSQTHAAFLATPPTSDPAPQHDTEASQQPAANGTDPAQYTLDDGPRGEPGTAAYYKSWAFRQKVKKGTNIVPEQGSDAGEVLDDSTDEGYAKKPRQTGKGESIIMVFSRTSVRRTRTQRKVTGRMQRSNRRA